MGTTFFERVIYSVRYATLCALVFISACDGYKSLHPVAESTTAPPPKQSALTNEQKFMLESLAGTPYFAQVEYINLRTETLPDSDPDDEFSETLHTFKVRVLEVYRGEDSPLLEFTAITATGENFELPEHPILISLCKNENGFYWPGVGASFPATEANLSLVKRQLIESKSGSGNYPLCD